MSGFAVKLVKKGFIIILAIMAISFVKAITEYALEDMTKDPAFTPFVMLAISLIFFVGGLWMVLRPIHHAKRMEKRLDKDEEFIKKHSFWGDFQKRLWEFGGDKDQAIQLKDPKNVRYWGIFITIFGLICTLVLVSLVTILEMI